MRCRHWGGCRNPVMVVFFFFLFHVPTIANSIRLLTSIEGICESLSLESLTVLLMTVSLTITNAPQFSRLLTSDHCRLGQRYDSLRESRQRQQQLASLIDYPEFHPTLLPINKVVHNIYLRAVILRSLERYYAPIATASFNPYILSFHERLFILGRHIKSFPGDLMDFHWQYAIINGLRVAQVAMILTRLWLTIDMPPFVGALRAVVSSLLEYRLITKFLRRNASSTKTIVRLVKLAMAKHIYQHEEEYDFLAPIIARILRETCPANQLHCKLLLLPVSSASMFHQILTGLLGKRGGGRPCQAAIHDLLVVNYMAWILDDTRTGNDLAIMPIPDSTTLMTISPARKDKLCSNVGAYLGDACTYLQKKKLHIWRERSVEVLHHKERFLSIHTDKDDVVDIKDLAKVAIRNAVNINVILKRPLRIHPNFPQVSNIRPFISQIMKYIESTEIIFKWDEFGTFCWRVDADTDWTTVYFWASRNAIALEIPFREDPIIPTTFVQHRDVHISLYTHIRNKMCDEDPGNFAASISEIANFHLNDIIKILQS